MNSKISKKDQKDWENFLSNKEKLPNKDLRFKKKNVIKSKTFDLHGYSLDEANKQVRSFINRSYEDGINRLIIVTGKGLHSENGKDPYISRNFGILKYSVPEYIKHDENLMSLINDIKEADVEDGGTGAFYIFLKKKL